MACFITREKSRLAVLRLMTFILAALSSVFWADLSFSFTSAPPVVMAFLAALSALLKARLTAAFLASFFFACFADFLADFVFGIA